MYALPCFALCKNFESCFVQTMKPIDYALFAKNLKPISQAQFMGGLDHAVEARHTARGVRDSCSAIPERHDPDIHIKWIAGWTLQIFLLKMASVIIPREISAKKKYANFFCRDTLFMVSGTP
jgi:hypothetical protein